MKRVFTLLLMLAVPSILSARLMKAWTYQEMFDKADLVVIAKPLSTNTTKEGGKVPTINPHYDFAGLSTEFEIRTVMKGEKSTNKFLLHHYRLLTSGPIMNGPSLVEFDPTGHYSFLLFLTKESDGRYAPVTGQSDPALFSVIKLEGIAQ